MNPYEHPDFWPLLRQRQSTTHCQKTAILMAVSDLREKLEREKVQQTLKDAQNENN